MRPPTRRALVAGLGGLGLAAAGYGAWRALRPGGPNVVLILTDDQGLNDLGCYYTPPPDARAYAKIETPHLDALAAGGVRLTQFYVAASICSPSRAALLTGCYPPRVGFGAKAGNVGVMTPESVGGLSPNETTIADLFRAGGYRTACIGKWHLGHLAPFRPTSNGFDEFFGIPWSNNQAPLMIVRGEEPVRRVDDQTPLTAPFTREAIEFVARNRDRPFFLYLAYSAPHEPWAVMPEFRGTSARGRYGDEIVELDHHVGLLLEAIRAQGLDRDTLVVFTSDNGPWLESARPGGSAFPLRGGKADLWEGGFRSPCLWRWPGVLPAGAVVGELVTALDLLPTFARVAGTGLGPWPIDGLDAWDVVARGAPSARTSFAYYSRGRLEAVRDGRFKRVHDVPVRTPPVAAALYDLVADPGETTDVAGEHPDVVARLDGWSAAMRAELGDDLTGAIGRGVRPMILAE